MTEKNAQDENNVAAQNENNVAAQSDTTSTTPAVEEKKVIMGAGDATGMFYHAVKGSEKPSSPSECTAEWLESKGYKKVGDVGVDGVTPTYDRSTEKKKNWANETVRVLVKEHTESLEIPAIETNLETAKTIFGESAVEKLTASANHGNGLDIHLDGSMPDAEAFILRMKDGNDRGVIYAKDATVTGVSINALTPGDGITWTATIEANSDGIHIMFDDGKTVQA